MSNSNLQLTISLLISNRMDTIPRCLDSLRPILDAIPSELILIDTSKNPEINALLKTYTDQVYEFTWCNDFAKARNEGLKRAKGEWFLFLDDDEWFVDVQPIIEFFQTGEYKEYSLAHYQIRNFENVDYTIYSDCWVSRMIQRKEDILFRGKIHEYFGNLRGKEKHLYAMAYHSGYIFDTEEKRLARAQRNIPLLEEMMEEEPDNIRWKIQLVQEKRSLREWEWIEDFCKNCIEKITDKEGLDTRTHFGTFYAGLVEALMFQAKHKESLMWCEKALVDERSTDLLKALIYNRIAENSLALRDWEKAVDYAKKYLHEYEKLSKNDTLMQEQMQALLVRHAFDESYLQKAYCLLVYEGFKKGSTKELKIYYDKLGWGTFFNYVTDTLVRLLVEVMQKTKEEPILVRALNDACQNEQLCNVACAKAREIEQDNPEVFQKLLPMYAKVASDFWYIWYAKMLQADVKHDKKTVRKAIEGLLQAIANVFYLTDRVYEIAAKYEVILPPLWEKIAGDDWERQLKVYVAGVDNARLNHTQKLIKEAYRGDNKMLAVFNRAVQEKYIMAGPDQFWDLEEYYNLLKDYFGLQGEDKIQDLTRLKEAVEKNPSFAEGIGAFIHLYPEFERQCADKQRKEMETLRVQVIEQVKALVENGQKQAAVQIVGQLKKMFPEDLEVAALALEIHL